MAPSCHAAFDENLCVFAEVRRSAGARRLAELAAGITQHLDLGLWSLPRALWLPPLNYLCFSSAKCLSAVPALTILATFVGHDDKYTRTFQVLAYFHDCWRGCFVWFSVETNGLMLPPVIMCSSPSVGGRASVCVRVAKCWRLIIAHVLLAASGHLVPSDNK